MPISTIGSDGLASSAVTRPKIGYAGAVLQVVQGTYGTNTNTTSTSYVTTGLTASITPTSSTSKILVIANLLGLYKNSANVTAEIALFKNGSSLFPFDGMALYNGTTSAISTMSSCTYLDSPATTSSTTYAVYIKVGGTGSVSWCNYGFNPITNSTITLMEIAG